MVLLAALAALALGQTAAPQQPVPQQPTPGTTTPIDPTTLALPKPRVFAPARLARRPVLTAPVLYGNWRSAQIGGAGGGGGSMQRVVYTADPRVLYAYADTGLYRSDDAGRRWRMLHGALPQLGAPAVRDLSVDPKDPDRALVLVGDQAAAPQGLFETRDGGRTWRKLLTVEAHGNGPLRWTGGLLIRDPREPRTILVGSAGDGVYRSTDDGRTWRQFGAGAGEPNGLLRDAYLTDLRFDRTDPRRVWAAATPTRAYGFEERRERDYEGGWFLSEDGGRTWTRLAEEAPTEFVQDGARPERLVGLFDGTSVRVSDDAGLTWRPYDEGLLVSLDPEREPVISDSRFDALSSGPGFQLLATTRGTLYRRNTNETAWQQVLPEGTTQIYEGRPWLYEDGTGRAQRFGIGTANVAIDPRDPNHLWLADLYAIYESRDGGKNWDLSMDGVETATVHTFEQDPRTSAVVHLGTAEGGYLTSRDGGTVFESPDFAANPLTGFQLQNPLASRTFRTAGTRITANLKAISAPRWAPERLIAVGDPGNGGWVSNTVWLSADRGGSWTRSPMTGLPNREAHAINTVAWDPSRENRAYAAVGGLGGGIFVSTDGGVSWLRESEGLPDEEDLFVADVWSSGRELALNGDGDIVVLSAPRNEIYRREAGVYVETTGIEGQPYDIVASETRNGAFLVATDRGVYRSTDAGRTWVRTLPRPARSVAVDRLNPRRVAAGCDDAILLSDDGGLTWREVDRALPDRHFPKVGFVAGRLLAGTAGSGVFWLPLDSQSYAIAETKPLKRVAVEIPEVRPGSFGRPLELLPDGGFEDIRGFGTRWTVGYTGRGRLEVATVGISPSAGARSLRLRAVTENSAGSAAARLVAPPRKFRVTGAARSAGATAEALIGVQAFDRDGRQTGFIVLFDARNADKWRRFSADVELPPGTETANLVATYAGSGSVSLDDVAFEAVVEGVTDPARPLPADILANGGFENANQATTDWIVGYQARGSIQISVTPVNPHSGERALVIRNGGSAPAEGAAAYKLLKLPRRFRFEGFARVENSTETGTPGTGTPAPTTPGTGTGTLRAASIAIQAFDFEGRQVTFSVAIDARTATEWRAFSTEIELPDEVESAYVVATFDGTGSLLLDDLRLTTLVERR